MQDEVIAIPTHHKRVPWNKGRLTGAKPPLRPKHVWAIRAKLQIEVRVRDLALFDLASGEFLFTGRRGPESSMTTRQYARLVSEWIGSAQKCQEPTFARLNDIQKRLSFEAGR